MQKQGPEMGTYEWFTTQGELCDMTCREEMFTCWGLREQYQDGLQEVKFLLRHTNLWYIKSHSLRLHADKATNSYLTLISHSRVLVSQEGSAVRMIQIIRMTEFLGVEVMTPWTIVLQNTGCEAETNLDVVEGTTMPGRRSWPCGVRVHVEVVGPHDLIFTAQRLKDRTKPVKYKHSLSQVKPTLMSMLIPFSTHTFQHPDFSVPAVVTQ